MQKWSEAPPQGEKVSAGLLMFRLRAGGVEFFLAHPGGPEDARADERVWTLPKGETDPGETLLDTALREFDEEVGLKVRTRDFVELGWVQQKSGKVVHAWAFEGNWEAGRKLRSIPFEIEWPPNSGRIQSFPEVDRVGFFPASEARKKIKPTQKPFIDRLETVLRLNHKLERIPKTT